jgi:hypothetical protein
MSWRVEGKTVTQLSLTTVDSDSCNIKSVWGNLRRSKHWRFALKSQFDSVRFHCSAGYCGTGTWPFGSRIWIYGFLARDVESARVVEKMFADKLTGHQIRSTPDNKRKKRTSNTGGIRHRLWIHKRQPLMSGLWATYVWLFVFCFVI